MIRADPRLREELRICHQMGLPHSRFLAWDELDQDKALAYAEYERAVCPGCGTRMEEWDPEQGGDRFAYAADVHTCPGCQTRGDLEHELSERDVQVSGRHVVLIPRTVAEEQRREADRRRAARMALVGA